MDHLQQREEHWAIVDLVGKGGHVRTVTVPVPDWMRTELEDWLAAAAIDRGKLFRRVNKVGRTWGRWDDGKSGLAHRAISLGARFGADNRTLPRLQAADSISRQ